MNGATIVFGLPLWLWLVFGLGLVGAAAYFARDLMRQRRARRAIDNVISSVAYDELRNVLLPTGAGMIFAGEKMEQWSVFGPKRHFTFTNPLPMLYDRMAAVRNLAGEVPVEGRIVFSMRGEFPKGRPEVVLRLDALQDEFPVVERTAVGAAAAFAPVWDQVKQAAQPNPLAGK